MPTNLDWSKHKQRQEDAKQWPNADFDWTGQASVPEIPKKSSALIVLVGTAFAFAALGGVVIAEQHGNPPRVDHTLSSPQKPSVG